ncbi:type II toxin-antitoxin system PemK/MazF family toxin [Phycicoccus sp. MAQZ13P-2]|uniref:type II toxin-antitoxin system PemK/MazF family toxin n=1 Tax=Phycicoccus mangrovi TaxID=2840470 RepID=UPI001C007D1A|nr:type II toxin-antitoxin system PemK/MazF family toxin [Phycicoccus mangrovi]MBT9258073.1 type II toxin-antitoxin system PemK/MazF family toxin [Phycicoccus mangrovi]MBT9276284.1 type II toxin-antitoxin system PemK/MazF family toxin [Phycicoccus mangrovi]
MQWQRILRPVLDGALRELLRGSRRAPGADAPTARQRSPRSGPPAPVRRTGGYPGDYTGPLDPVYAPRPDGRPDPGEIVWTWVPYEEDHTQGKDRPVLLVGHDGDWLLGLQLTSKDHDRDAEQERRAGRRWVDIGTGAWDRQGRPSEVRVNRVLRVDPAAVRREGAVLDRARFLEVAAAVRATR